MSKLYGTQWYKMSMVCQCCSIIWPYVAGESASRPFNCSMWPGIYFIPPVRLYVEKVVQSRQNMWKHYMTIKEGMERGEESYHTKVWLSWKGYWIYHVKSISGVSWVRNALRWTKCIKNKGQNGPREETLCWICSADAQNKPGAFKAVFLKPHLKK